MKKYKLAVALFVVTLCIGGITNTLAASLKLDGLKADFLQTVPHYTKVVNKTTLSSQKITVTSTTGSRSVLLAEYDGNGSAINSEFMLFAANSSKDLESALFQLTGERKLRAKLSYPWTQVSIKGTWYYDM